MIPSILFDQSLRDVIAAAIANARGMRRGAPSMANVLEILPPKLKNEVLDDADNIIAALREWMDKP
jgi:hypothetical protein